MQLEQFVAETIQQIVVGVATAKKAAKEHGAEVNPDVGSRMRERQPGVEYRDIKFDVAVTTTEGSKEKGGIGIFVGPVGVGAQAHAESANQSVSRIQFAVPILYP